MASDFLIDALSAAQIEPWEYDHVQDRMKGSAGLWNLLGYASDGDTVDVATWISMIHPEDRGNAQKHWDTNAMGDPSKFELIFRCQVRSGEWRWIQSRGQVSKRDECGRPLKSSGIAFDVTARHSSIPSSNISMSRVKTLIESIPVGVYTFRHDLSDGSMSFDFMSEHACFLLGVEKDLVLENAMIAFNAAHPEEREYLLRSNDSLRHGTPFFFEGRFIVRGEIRWLRLQSNRVSLDDQVSQWDGIITDISEEIRQDSLAHQKAQELHRKLNDHAEALARTTNELETTTERLEFALKVSNIGVWDWNLGENTLFYAPDTAFPKSNWDERTSDLLTHWKTFIHPEDVQHVAQSFEHQTHLSDAYELEYRIRNNEGSYRWILARGCVVERDAEGNPRRLIGNHTDIDERRKADIERRSLVGIIEASNDLIAFSPAEADFNGKVTYLNAAGRRLLGLSKDQPLGELNIKDAHPPSAYERIFREAIPQAMITGSWQGDNIFLTKDGSLKEFSQLILAPRDPDTGEVLFLATVCRDISDRKRLESELTASVGKLEEADRRKDEFLATLAHELRNPLTPVAIATGILERDGITPEQFKWCVGSISRQTKHLKRLIDDLLDVSRINRGLITLERHPIDLYPLLVEVVEMFAPKATEKGQRITLHCEEGAIHINADPVRLLQILGNLISNAIKFSPRDAEITVSAIRDRNILQIAIKDQGIGIAPEDQGSVFGLFTQIKEPRSPSNDGLGIGLYLVKHLIDLHGGEIGVQSDGLGKGSEFTIKLPLEDAETVASDENESKPKAGAKRLRILVVDDNLDAQATLALYLGLQGNEVHTATDGLKAIAIAKSKRPQLIILDIGLPEMNGYDVCREIRQQSWGKRIVIVALSGWGQKEDKEKAIASGFDVHFTKPLDPAVFEDFLERQKDKLLDLS